MLRWQTIPLRYLNTLSFSRKFRSSAKKLQRQRQRRHLPGNDRLLTAIKQIKATSPGAGASETSSAAAESNFYESASVAINLPQSPLTDPKLNAARFGHKERKPADDQISTFQAELRNNVYAQALASPVRQCGLTGAHLPSSFLLKFGLTADPRTGHQWHLPKIAAEVSRIDRQRERQQSSIARRPAIPNGYKDEDAKSLEGTIVRSEDRNDALESSMEPVSNSENPQIVKDHTGQHHVPPRALHGTQFIRSHRALENISRLPSKKYTSILPHSWMSRMTLKDVVWREDMVDFALNLMRRQIISWIHFVATRKNTMYCMPCASLQDVRRQRSVACVLCLKSPIDGDDLNHIAEEAREDVNGHPILWIPMLYYGRRVPVYFMQRLLGSEQSEQLDELRQSLPKCLDGDFAVIRKKHMTMDLQMKLWQLVGYMQ